MYVQQLIKIVLSKNKNYIFTCTYILLTLQTSVKAATIPVNTTEKKSFKETMRTARISEWLAFGSGCRGSSKQETQEVQFKSIYGQTILAQFFPNSFFLQLPDGVKGVRECALRVSVEPPPDVRIKHLQARTRLQASKTDAVHLRSRIVLLIGDHLLANNSWDLQKNDFAKMRDETITLVPGSRSDLNMPQVECGKPQIIGIDFTFEGIAGDLDKGSKKKEDSFLRLYPKTPVELEIFFEQCKNQ
jgi:hypothetical protein